MLVIRTDQLKRAPMPPVPLLRVIRALSALSSSTLSMVEIHTRLPREELETVDSASGTSMPVRTVLFVLLGLIFVGLILGSCVELAAHQDHIHGVSWLSPQLILSGCERGLLMAHDTRAASVAWSVDMNGKGVCSLYALPEDGIGQVGHTDGGVSLLDLRERRVLSSYTLHNGDVRSVAMWNESNLQQQTPFNGSGGLYSLTTSFDNKGCVWRLHGNAARGKVSHIATEFRKVQSLIGHTDKILCGVFSPVTNDIFTSGADGNVMCWSPHKE